MEYCDVHTHRPSIHPEDLTIVNRMIGGKEEYVPARFCTYGIHPWYIYNAHEQLEQLRTSVSNTGVVAIGEAGLDKLAEASMKVQLEVFSRQACLAEEVGKPLIIHCVKAWPELIAVRKAVSPHMPWIVHGFRGNGELAKQLVRQGFCISFGSHFTPEALQAAWSGTVFAETDDLETDIRSVYSLLATSLHLPLELFALKIRENVRRVFSV